MSINLLVLKAVSRAFWSLSEVAELYSSPTVPSDW